jgi:geranylgeranyl pyrophosphate synthase
MARALELIAADDQRIRAFVADAAKRVARGQAREMTDLYREDVSVDEYLERAADKTGALFELAARLGGIAGGFDLTEQEILADCGQRIGLAFQLVDDVRDVVGGATLGRERGTDIREGVYTPPVLLTLSERRPGWERLRTAMRHARLHRDQVSVDTCCEIVTDNGGLAIVITLAREQLKSALTNARRLPNEASAIVAQLGKRIERSLDGVAPVVA